MRRIRTNIPRHLQNQVLNDELGPKYPIVKLLREHKMLRFAIRDVADHFRKVRELSYYCECEACCEARISFANLKVGDLRIEQAIGGLCYWLPKLVLSCRKCGARWDADGIYPGKCPECDSETWNQPKGKTA